MIIFKGRIFFFEFFRTIQKLKDTNIERSRTKTSIDLHIVHKEGNFRREREQKIINKIEIDTHLLVNWRDQIKLGRFSLT